MTAALHAAAINSADVAVLLLLCGILLLYAEFNRPGTILLGAFGALLMMLGVARLLPLRVSPAAILVVGAGAGLLLFEVRFPLRGVHRFGVALAATGLITGLHLLVSQPDAVHWSVAVCAGAVFSIVTYALGRIALLAARNKRLPGTLTVL